jgi:hypothetical protein
MRQKIAVVLGVLLMTSLIGCADKILPVPTATTTPQPKPTFSTWSALQFAEAYFSAVIHGDKPAAKALLVPSARCTPTDLWNRLDKQLTFLDQMEVRVIDISDKDISHLVEIYAPGARSACVAFEYKKQNSPGWSPANICVVVETGICDMWLTGE